ncbi:MAG TPA: carboxypeptidase regulatory-like domain-containing protein [Kofleriaceae bacterium]|jgi:hypothetical protein|nr:carboxypeptidase regulatory-like domain-containing protein [Kofleriaceae bacterium]
MNLNKCLCSVRSLGWAIALGAAACSSPQPAMQTPDAGAGPDASEIPPDAAASTVTFSYTPGWDGVQSVEVIGGFGQATDWTAPLVTLAPSGGTFTGTATLAPGSYLYVFHIVGDAAAGAKAATASRYAIDPAAAVFAACPMQSPTFSANEPNPCGQITVPVGALPAMYHVRGSVTLNGAPAAGYLVVLERDEASSHHFFVDRVTTGADGAYDLTAAAGQYRVQVQHPEFESKTDAQLTPAALGIVRRSISTPFPLTADMTVPAAEVAFADYAKFAPVTTAPPPSATAPTAFTFGTTGGMATRLDVYGTAMAGKGNQIGDPWFASTPTATGAASFDGTFNTKQAAETAVATGERYFWGVEQTVPKASGVGWTRQSLVFPLTWK